MTKTLLACGIIAGPLYTILALVQVAIRPGFDITRHSLSLLANGDLGWIQILNFLVTGALLFAGAIGTKRMLQPGIGGRWAPRMLGLYGLGLIAAGIFTADPALGFPPGTPLENNPVSWHGMLHLIAGMIGFAGFVAACFIFARRFRSLRQPGWAYYSMFTGAFFLAAFVGIASGSKGPVSAIFAVAVVVGFAWITAVSARLAVELRERVQTQMNSGSF